MDAMTGIPNINRALELLGDIMKMTEIAATLEFIVVSTAS